jgi:hypothetical protein
MPASQKRPIPTLDELLNDPSLKGIPVEHQKLQWMVAPPASDSRPRKIFWCEDARFDFNGNSLSTTLKVPASLGLHHHSIEVLDLFVYVQITFV